MKIGVIGKGFVGGAITTGFETQGHEVLVHDTKLNTKIENVLEAPLLYVCVPTPSSKDGSCNTDIVESVLGCLLYTSPSPRDLSTSRMPSSA